MIVSIHQPNYLPWLGYFNKISRSDIFVLDRSQYKKFNEIKINYDGWNHKHLVNIKNFYKKTPFFNLYYDDLENIILKEYDTISDLSTSLIKYFLIQLDIDTEVVLSSTICKDSNLQGIDKIFYILESFPTDKYLTSDGPGSMRYIKEEDFKEKNIELVWQKFHHPTYTQRFGEFKSHLSIIDLLFNYGDESRGYIK